MKREVLAGAVLGVLTTLAALFALMGSADERWVTRREYNATLTRIDKQLDRIEIAVKNGGRDAHR